MLLHTCDYSKWIKVFCFDIILLLLLLLLVVVVVVAIVVLFCQYFSWNCLTTITIKDCRTRHTRNGHTQRCENMQFLQGLDHRICFKNGHNIWISLISFFCFGIKRKITRECFRFTVSTLGRQSHKRTKSNEWFSIRYQGIHLCYWARVLFIYRIACHGGTVTFPWPFILHTHTRSHIANNFRIHHFNNRHKHFVEWLISVPASLYQSIC